jgi:ribosomal protein S18 acetylase RimI-like enzyme
MSEGDLVIRTAVPTDDAALLQIDRQTQTTRSTPGQLDPDKTAFLRPDSVLADHLVAEQDGVVVGYVMVEHPTPLTSNRHVMHIAGLAVAPEQQGRGIGARLLDAMIAELARRGVRKVGLRVLSWNEPALRLYRSCGFETEGVLRGEFVLDGALVDDHLMARWLTEER